MKYRQHKTYFVVGSDVVDIIPDERTELEVGGRSDGGRKVEKDGNDLAPEPPGILLPQRTRCSLMGLKTAAGS